LSVFKVSNQKLSSVINCSSKNGVRINIYNCEYYALINKCNIFCRELMMWTAILKRQSHLQSFCVVPLRLILWLYVQYVVGKGKVLCDALREFKLLDCLNLLLFVQYTYGCYYHQVQQLDKNLHSWGYCWHFVPIPTQEGISVFINEDDIAY
jgi:hypothetical protein